MKLIIGIEVEVIEDEFLDANALIRDLIGDAEIQIGSYAFDGTVREVRRMNLAAARYDAWVTRDDPRLSEPDETWQMQLHCERCGGWLKILPDRSEPWEDTIFCDGTPDPTYGVTSCDYYTRAHEPHYAVMAAGVYEYRTCGRCGRVNKTTEM